MHYCSLSTDKQYQLADWRIRHRPLLPDMLHYARADTHYLLYVYDRVRADLLTKALGRPNLLQLVWDQSRTVALKVSGAWAMAEPGFSGGGGQPLQQ
ncbi:exosome complex component 10-like [Petromyzon marinus]|uniref:exosome complex component 10-like n=1 Tax=Petromyzon marinus TaxID=7757 RepID=UPI003F6E9325